MAGDMPERPRQHNVSTESARRLLNALPVDWVANTPAEDYGIDFDIEVFENGHATGIHFYVQLKATDSSGDDVQIKRSTLNYWEALELPTLLVLHSSATDALRWQWAHLLGITPGSSAKKRTAHVTETWNDGTPSALLRELKARRATTNPAAHLPLFIGVHTEAEVSPLMARVRGGLRRLPQVHPRLTAAEVRATSLRYEILLGESAIDLRLVGLPFAHLNYAHAVDGPETMAPIVIGDVFLTMGVHLARVGLLDIGCRLVAPAILTCSRIWDPNVAAEVAVLFARAGFYEDLASLMRRIYVEQDTDSGMYALIALQVNERLVPLETRRAIADEIAEVASNDQARARSVYNAGGLLRHDDFDRARELYERAASLDPDYRRRGYWWSEQAATYFHQGDLASARAYYSTAIELGYKRAIPLLADAMLRSGEYTAALEIFAQANAEEALSHPQWRLTQYAFDYLTTRFAIDRQDRDPARAERLRTADGAPNGEVLLKALEADLLDPFALWAATHFERDQGRETLPFFVGAAVLLLNMPVLWEEALRSAWSHAPGLVPDIVACIKQHCREEFLAFLDEDDFLDGPHKTFIAWLIEQMPEPEDPQFELRDQDGRAM